MSTNAWLHRRCAEAEAERDKLRAVVEEVRARCKAAGLYGLLAVLPPEDVPETEQTVDVTTDGVTVEVDGT